MIQKNLVKSYIKDIDWRVSGLFAHDRFIWELLNICEAYKITVPIKSVYGSIPCLFQGGNIPPRTADMNNVRGILQKYDDLGISCQLTFSNMMIDDLNDETSNELLKILNSLSNTRHGVIVAQDSLLTHIRDNYKNLYIVSSIVKPTYEVGLGNDTVGYYNDLSKRYDYVEVNPFKVNEIDFLANHKDREKVIFSVNNRCLPNCDKSWEHADLIMNINTKSCKKEDFQEELKSLDTLLGNCIKLHQTYPLAGNQMSQSDIEMLLRYGYKNFSLEGRCHDATCFIRDMGDYIFESYLFNRIACAIMGGNV